MVCESAKQDAALFSFHLLPLTPRDERSHLTSPTDALHRPKSSGVLVFPNWFCRKCEGKIERKGLFTLGKWSFPKIFRNFFWLFPPRDVGKLSSTIFQCFLSGKSLSIFQSSGIASLESSKLRLRGFDVRKMGPVAFPELKMTFCHSVVRALKHQLRLFSTWVENISLLLVAIIQVEWISRYITMQDWVSFDRV